MMLGLRVVDKRRLPPSSRHHESGVWQDLHRLEVAVVWTLRGATGRQGGATGRQGGATGGKRGPLR
jgi:hypothetical protein